MNKKFKIKTGDTVIVITGKDKGKTGKIIKMVPKKMKAVVSEINKVKKNQKPDNNQPGGIIDKEMPIHISNLSIFKSEKEKKLFSSLGEDIGLLFQLSDDFLDKKGSSKLMGKPVKNDSKKGKSTLLKLMGDKRAFLYAESLKKNILNKLRKHGKNARELINTINFIFDRKF